MPYAKLGRLKDGDWMSSVSQASGACLDWNAEDMEWKLKKGGTCGILHSYVRSCLLTNFGQTNCEIGLCQSSDFNQVFTQSHQVAEQSSCHLSVTFIRAYCCDAFIAINLLTLRDTYSCCTGHFEFSVFCQCRNANCIQTRSLLLNIFRSLCFLLLHGEIIA